jgi:hypothetical protein
VKKEQRAGIFEILASPQPYIIQAMATPITVRISWAVFPDTDRRLDAGF